MPIEETEQKTETKAPEQPNIHTIAVRIQEWTAYLPQSRSPEHPQVMLSEGISFFEVTAGESVTNLEVTGIPNATKHFSMTNPEDGSLHNVPHGLYAFQATICGRIEGRMPEPPQEDQQKKTDTKTLILPNAGPNRATRRANGNGK